MERKLLLSVWLFFGLISFSIAQNQSITGKVSDQQGNALPGVSVVVRGSNQGATTDASGNYQVTAAPNTKLGFSFIGFLSQEVTVGNQSVINITLLEDSRQLEEVVVSGLATNVKRTNLANAVATLSAKTLTGTTTPITTDGAMQGKLAGANIQSNGSVPGGGFNVQLRGVSTLGSSASQPLYIVDGVYIDNGQYSTGRSEANKAGTGSSTASQDNNANRLADLNPDDIESMEVLKGSSAAAIYGTRANAGVVIITTKRGKGGRTNVSFGQDLGFTKAYSFYGGADWTEQKLTDHFSAADIPKLQAARQNGTYTDWERVIYGETGSIKNTHLSVTGGNEKTKFYVNGSASNETGIIKNTGFTRYSIRANIDHKLNNWIDFGISSNYVNSNNDRGWTGNDNSNINYGYSLPYTKPYTNLYPDATGVYPDNDPSVGENPLAIRDRAVNNQKVNRFIQGFNANFRLINNATTSLTLKVNGGIDYQSGFATIWLPTDLQSQRLEANPGFSQDTRTEVYNSNIQVAGVFTYAAMGGKLNLTTSAGAVRLHRDFNYNFVRGQKLPVGVSNPARGGVQTIAAEYQRNTDVGIFAQQEANYDDKLIGTVGVRFDKSDLNGDNFGKYYAFPKASLAANLTRFGSWASERNTFSALKLRIAYGSTAGLPVWGTAYSQLQSTAIGGLSGLQPSTILGNPQIKPESATELEYGLDFGLFNNRITGEFTLYNKKVYDLILPLVTAPTTGVTSTQINAADLVNRGLELTLGAEVLRSKAVTWFIQPIFWFNRSEVTRLIVPESLRGGFGATFGQWRIKGPDANGNKYSPTQIVGQPRTLPTTDPNYASSWTSYGDQQPKYEFSLNQRVTFLKNFEFSALLHYRHKFTVVSLQRVLWDEGGNTSDWNGTNERGNNGQQPNGIYRQNVNGLDESGKPLPGYNPNIYSFLKLREVSLYYRLPKTVLQSVFRNYVQGIRIGASGTNLLRWTDYTAGYDPENSNFGSLALGSGVDIGSAPLARRMMFHIAIDL
ncbi:SusC/RagA family TonB-linked outer membrane protein [Spirosoma sp. KNUC1025]|uniref:SusC/RagA family TonB-linked outer membrane protein n=1 Tax=Spirosoma sp. KNUC1025 TaxID=2894082 RepID=UPI0038671F55|nr:SusC/RagA family TonB-linked outer membrane protein [Spirosoma sp. KNUC1025]